MDEASLEWGALVTRAVAPFIRQAVAPEVSPFDRPAFSRPLRRVFSYATRDIPPAERVEGRWVDGDTVVERISYATGPLTRASACLVAPASVSGPLPGLVVLHCHSGVYEWGKEKVCAPPEEPERLRRLRAEKYGGRSIAHDLAARGFIVLAPDAFYFGIRAVGTMGDGIAFEALEGRRRGSEQLVAKALGLAGHSWPAVMAWEDQRALDVLWRRADVDPGRIGCLGLSLGGFRAMLLAAKDRRVNAVVTAGWLGTAADLLGGHIIRQSWTVLPWGLLPDLDFPDIAAAAHPAAFLALLCRRDHLFTPAGMQAAARTLIDRYRAAGAEAAVAAEFYDVTHGMTVEMQERATAWLEEFVANRPLAEKP
jgi:dienelactone hydrolase